MDPIHQVFSMKIHFPDMKLQESVEVTLHYFLDDKKGHNFDSSWAFQSSWKTWGTLLVAYISFEQNTIKGILLIRNTIKLRFFVQHAFSEAVLLFKHAVCLFGRRCLADDVSPVHHHVGFKRHWRSSRRQAGRKQAPGRMRSVVLDAARHQSSEAPPGAGSPLRQW